MDGAVSGENVVRVTHLVVSKKTDLRVRKNKVRSIKKQGAGPREGLAGLFGKGLRGLNNNPVSCT